MDADRLTPDRSASYVETQQAVAAFAVMLTEAASETARAQWAVMDSPPGDAPLGSRGVIDPEALLLVSLWLIPRDSAIETTVHEWVARWSDLLSVQRTRNIAKQYSEPVQGRLRQVAITAHERGKDFRWTPVIKGTGTSSEMSDDAAAMKAAHASPPSLSKARLAVEHDALLMLRFRMAFGVGARADALAYLLARGSSWSTVTEIAQATGYTPSAIRRALDRMAEAEIVLTVDDGTTRYRCDPAPWGMLLGMEASVAPWQYWLQHFTFIATFVEWADGIARRKLTSYAILEAMRGMARQFRPTDDRDGLRAWDHAFRDGSSMAEMEEALTGVAAALLSES
jgi:DNA-binding transcriptional ArsR family regulator